MNTANATNPSNYYKIMSAPSSKNKNYSKNKKSKIEKLPSKKSPVASHKTHSIHISNPLYIKSPKMYPNSLSNSKVIKLSGTLIPIYSHSMNTNTMFSSSLEKQMKKIITKDNFKSLPSPLLAKLKATLNLIKWFGIVLIKI